MIGHNLPYGISTVNLCSSEFTIIHNGKFSYTGKCGNLTNSV